MAYRPIEPDFIEGTLLPPLQPSEKFEYDSFMPCYRPRGSVGDPSKTKASETHRKKQINVLIDGKPGFSKSAVHVRDEFDRQR